MQVLLNLRTDESHGGADITFRWLSALGLFALVLFCYGCRNPGLVTYYTASSLDPRAVHYGTNTLQEGDLVAIIFQYSTNYNAIQKITLDGMLNLEGVGSVKATGRTVPQLQTELLKLYHPLVKDELITVKMMTSATTVYVAGAVAHPGKIPLEHPMTVLEAVMEAGGFDPNRAKLSAVTVLRIEDGKQKCYTINLKQTLRGEIETPFYLKPSDVVHVPTKTFNF